MPTRTVLLRSSVSSSTNGLKQLTYNSSWQLGVSHLIDIYGYHAVRMRNDSDCFLDKSTSQFNVLAAVRPVNKTLLCRVVPTPFAWISTTHRVLDRLDFWHGRVFYVPTFKIQVNLFCLKRDLGTLPQKVFIFRTFHFGANAEDC